ncbi:MAG: ATP-dependent helicase [Oscillatoria sp. SIO1A7]|nr:ATP-dependent helicase [Oscillatoria sp. SIO1A7]
MTNETLSLEAQRQIAWERIRERLRPGQQQMADWTGGPLAVSAVPGAGKSKGMADAAALAIARHKLHYRHHLLLVTFTRSAAANLKVKIRQTLEKLQLPRVGFFVYTLHGLALNIAIRHPELSGISLDNATLVTPNQSHRLIRTCVERWIVANPRLYPILLEGRQFDGEETERLRRQSVLRTEVLPQLAHTVVHEAKSSGLSPRDLWELAQTVPQDDYQIMAVASGLYDQYEILLRSRNFIDYDDMILAAKQVLSNQSARLVWQKQVFAVFEDEAQDSTPLQAELLEILASDPNQPDAPPNIIRVGDPNQAINSTFTPADPIYFRRFCQSCASQNSLALLDRAGRSSQSIIDAANFMLQWANEREKAKKGRDNYDRSENGFQSDRSSSYSSFAGNDSSSSSSGTPFSYQKIEPVDPGDPQPDANPPATGGGLEIYTPSDIYQTIDLIGQRAISLLIENKNRSAAILVRENRQGQFIAEVLGNPKEYKIKANLAKHGIELHEVAAGDRRSNVPAEILALMNFLHRPHSPDYLKAALRILVFRSLIKSQDINTLASAPEQFLYPGPIDPLQSEPVLRASQFCKRLLGAKLKLPLYQLISFLALELNYNQGELATADKLAERVAKQTARENSMQSILEVLTEIVSSERFEPVNTEEDPNESLYTKPGRLVAITMHKAKGLDWDYVFIPFLHEAMIPGHMRVLLQAQFLGDYALAEVARAQIRAELHGLPVPDAGQAWQEAEKLKTAEEFRLLYVAMTRAKRLLWMSAARKAPFTWSKPDSLQAQKPSPILPALKARFPESVR